MNGNHADLAISTLLSSASQVMAAIATRSYEGPKTVAMWQERAHERLDAARAILSDWDGRVFGIGRYAEKIESLRFQLGSEVV